jgi:serine protease
LPGAPVHSLEGLIVRIRTLACLLIAVALAGATPAVLASNDTYRNQQWGLDRVGAEKAWSKATGSGITIAVVDSGVDLQHEDLKGKLVTGRNFIEDGSPPQDDDGHGTHVAGIAAAVVNNGKGVAGVAPKAKIMPIRVLQRDGDTASGSIEDITAGVHWAVDHGAKVVNLSVSEAGLIKIITGGSLASAVNYAWSKGAIPVVTAGNNGVFPSGYRGVNAIVVTATTRNDQMASYASAVGPSAQWGIAAPGGSGAGDGSDNILATYWVDGSKNRYAYLAGTSMAAPFVSGAAALLLSRGLTPMQTVNRLLETAKDLGASGTDSEYGHGRLDIAAAAAGLSSPSGPVPTQRAGSNSSSRNVASARPEPVRRAAPVSSSSTTAAPTPSGTAVAPPTLAPSAPPISSPVVIASAPVERTGRGPVLPVAAAAMFALAGSSLVVARRRA